MKTEDYTTKYTNAVNGNKAIMFLYEYIGQPPKGINDWIRPQYFADEMYYHNQMGREICVYINSPGGQIYGGFTIIQALLDCEADTHIVGMAASMAGVVAQFGKRRTMNDFAVGMVHPPGGSAGPVLELARQQLRDCLTKKSKLSAKKIEALLEDGADDTWLDSSQMESMGLVDEVISTGKKKPADFLNFNLKNGMEKFSDINETFKIYTDIVNSLTESTNLTSKNDMDITKIGAELGIENPTEATVLARLKELQTSNAAIGTVKTELETEKTAKAAIEAAKKTAEDTLLAERSARATELIENAILAGKIKEEVRKSYTELAVTNYDLAKQTLAGIVTAGAPAHASVHNVIDTKVGDPVNEETYENLAQNHPKKLAELFEKDRAKYDRLEAAYIAKSQTK